MAHKTFRVGVGKKVKAAPPIPVYTWIGPHNAVYVRVEDHADKPEKYIFTVGDDGGGHARMTGEELKNLSTTSLELLERERKHLKSGRKGYAY